MLPPIFKPPPTDRRSKQGLYTAMLLLTVAVAVSPRLRSILYNALMMPRHHQAYKQFGIHLPGSFTVHGIDVSRYQESVDWQRVASMQVGNVRMTFAFIKATEGSWIVDPRFRENWLNARKAGVIRGAYHYFLPDIRAKDQAGHFVRQVRLEQGDLPPVVDIEEARRMTKAQVANNTLTFLRLLEKAYGVKPILYTNKHFYLKYFADQAAFKDYPLWIAHYRVPSPELPDDIPWHFWQHHDAGRVQGIKGAVDFNVFNGTLQDLNKWRLP
jgi:lysozyme